MKKYKTLFFDVDDTLLDFGAAESLALRMLFEEKKIPFTTEIEAKYKQINQNLWRAFEEGKISRDDVVNTRYSVLFKEYGQDVDGVLMENSYRGYLERGHQLVQGAYDVVTTLQKQFDLYIVTNGILKTQDKRLRASGLYPHFKDIFVSEVTGYQKPMKEYFDYVFNRIPNFSLEEGLIIGDSLNADIKGGKIAGLDTCWFNPELKPNKTEIVPTYQIQKLDELYRVLGVDEKRTIDVG